MPSALIGATGFVGGNLLRQARFDDCYNSRNIEDIRGRSYDLVVCAAAPAEKWRANQQPDQDRVAIERLTTNLAGMRAREVVLISTVDVYPEPVGVDEESQVDPDRAAPYGRHRYELERFVAGRFPTRVIRLPGLFGPGLKKNLIFDLLQGRLTMGTSGASVYQFYDLGRLWGDIEIVRRHGLHLVNFATEGVTVTETAQAVFGIQYVDGPEARSVTYDMRTRFATLFGGRGAYLESRAQVFERLCRFVVETGWVRP